MKSQNLKTRGGAGMQPRSSPRRRSVAAVPSGALLLTLLLAFGSGCERAARAPGAAVNDGVARLLTDHRVPGVAITLVSNGAAGWTAGFGTSDTGAGTHVTPRTVFEAASLSKPVFAYLVMKLAHEGRFDLDAPVSTYLPAGRVNSPPGSPVTPRQILAHTAGLPPRLPQGEIPLQVPPGNGWRYSGGGYVLLQHAVEHALNEPLETLARHHVFDPLGMVRTGFGWHHNLAGDVALPHDSAGQPLAAARYDADDVDRGGAASTLYTTASDFGRFVAEVSRSDTEPWVRAMFEPQVIVDDGLSLSWGLGWALQHDSEGDVIAAFHWGANPHFRSFAIVYPGTGRGWVALANGPLGLEMMDELGRLLGSVHPLFDFYMMHPTD